MAKITKANLIIEQRPEIRKIIVKVDCNVKLTPLEISFMKLYPEINLFRLKCKILGTDEIDVPEDAVIMTDEAFHSFKDVFYFPDPTPISLETRTFTTILGGEVIEEDGVIGADADKIYARIHLENLFSGKQITRNTNTGLLAY